LEEPATTDSTELFGRWRIKRTLAFGGMAQILLAREERGNQLVVLKRILPHFAQNKEFVQFFIHEGRLGQRLLHPNVVKTLEAGQVGDQPYIALEYLRGQPCIEVLRTAAKAKLEVPLGVAVRIVADAARGLHHAHAATDGEGRPLGVVHRDVTPHNLFVCADGVTKVLDFGIAKAASQLHHTRTGTIKGKFAYLAPEQIKGEGIDHRVDVFALGIVLHELLTLRPLFRGGNDAETLQKVLALEIPAPERMRSGLPPGIGAVALRALQRDRERRLPTAEALADSLEAVANAHGISASHEDVRALLLKLFPDPEDLGHVAADGAPSLMRETPPAGVSAVDDDRETEPIDVLGPEQESARRVVSALAGTGSRTRHQKRTGRVALLVSAAALLLGGSLLATTWHDSKPAAPPVAQAAHDPALVEPLPLANKPAAASAAREQPKPGALPAAAMVPAAKPQGLPSAEEATLRVQTDGTASFLVDGRQARAASDGALHLTPGRHAVTVSSTALASPRSFTIELRPGEAAMRTVHGGRGTLRLAVSPWAEVQIDGRAVGVTPLQPQDLSEGQHWIQLKNGDLGVNTKRRVLVSPGRETVLKVDLFSKP
jgi:eukaryotic-like serine/threonine-protein kinase